MKRGGGNLNKACLICGTEFTLKHPNQRYCGPKCQITARKRQVHRDVQHHRQKYRNTQKQELYEAINHACQEQGNIIMKQYHIGKGTTKLGPKPNTDFNQELLLIEREMKRLKIKT